MFLGASVRAVCVVLCLGQLVAACSSWDEDTPDHVDFALPSITWTVSSAAPQWREPPPPGVPVPSFVCSGPEALSTDCCAPPYDCQKYPFACDPTSNFCALTFDVEGGQTVDLVNDVPAIAAVQGRAFAKVELLSLNVSVSLAPGLPIRATSLYIGPHGLPASSDPAATFFAPVKLVSGAQAVVPDVPARQAFSSFARDYETPFSLLLSAHVVVSSDNPPKGDLRATLTAQARAFY